MSPPEVVNVLHLWSFRSIYTVWTVNDITEKATKKPSLWMTFYKIGQATANYIDKISWKLPHFCSRKSQPATSGPRSFHGVKICSAGGFLCDILDGLQWFFLKYIGNKVDLTFHLGGLHVL